MYWEVAWSKQFPSPEDTEKEEKVTLKLQVQTFENCKIHKTLVQIQHRAKKSWGFPGRGAAVTLLGAWIIAPSSHVGKNAQKPALVWPKRPEINTPSSPGGVIRGF